MLSGVIESAEAEICFSPKSYNYTLADFQGIEPYEKLFQLRGNQFLYLQELDRVAENATEVKFKGFRGKMQAYEKQMLREYRKNKSIVPNQTEFDGQYLELNCGDWESVDYGIFRDVPGGGRECACPHPIMPIERLRNIDTGEVKVRLAFRRQSDAKWSTIIVSKKTIANTREIISLAEHDVAVNSNNAKSLVAYLDDMLEMNYDLIPQRKSIGRLGYIEGEGFSPYVEDLAFDGDASFRNLYGYVKSHGDQIKWYETALECRKMSVTARILLASSFASPLLSVVGALPFFVHMWGGSETGKTVALMLAASVWGDPLKGRLLQTFNATRVGQEMTASFLNHLPMCLDELQLTKNGKGQSSFDVYQLAEGVGRTRGKKAGGVEMTPTWDCCFLTTGEDPIIGLSAGGGAVNRVIEIECFTGQKVIEDGHRIAAALTQNYGWAGQLFVKKLYESDKVQEQVRGIYQDFFNELNKNDTTDKQSLAAAAILTADLLATLWIFQDDNELTVDEIKAFLASKEAVSAGARAYSWICNWVAENENHFYTEMGAPTTSVYGRIEYNMAYINNNVLSNALNEANFNATATYSYLKTKNLIVTGSGRGYGRTKKIGGSSPYCIWLRLPSDQSTEILDDELL